MKLLRLTPNFENKLTKWGKRNLVSMAFLVKHYITQIKWYMNDLTLTATYELTLCRYLSIKLCKSIESIYETFL